MTVRDLDWNRIILNLTGASIAVGIVTLLAVAMALLMWRAVPDVNHDILLVIITGLIAKTSTIVDALYGNYKSRQQAETIATQANTISQAQNALAPLDAGTMKLDPGDTATALATDDGTVIKKTSDPSPGDTA